MIKWISILIIPCFLVACSSNENELPKVAQGGKSYGGEFRFMSLEKVTNLFPMHSLDLYSQRINTQIFESLFKEDPSGKKVIPHLVEEHFVSADGLKHTIKLRKGIYFHENDCFEEKTRELNAADIQYVLEFACSGLSLNHLAHLLVNKIKGANEFHKVSKKSLSATHISGIKIIDEYSLSISLTKPYAEFEKILSHPGLGIFPKEAYLHYGTKMLKNPVGTGPFQLDKMNEEGIRLERNNRYWRKDSFGNQLPFLASLSMRYVKDKNSELLAFEKNQVDIVLEVPVENVQDLFGSLAEAQRGKTIRHRIFSRKSSSINYLAFSLDKEPFNNIHVRKAFQLAIDRNKIVNDVLLGEGFPAINGFIPAMEGFVSDSTIQLPFDPLKAKQELAKAGYPGGVGFPSLKLWVNSIDGSSVSKWTSDIIAQLKTNLGINIQLQYCSFNEKTEAISRGDALIWRSGWVADYPDPESFLSIFYAEHAAVNPYWGNISTTNSLFNENYEKSIVEQNTQNRIFYLNQCNKILLDEALVIPVYSDDFFVVLNLMLRDFQVNSLETMDLSMAYFKAIQ